MTRFLDKAEREGTAINDDQLCDIVFNFLLAGRDTTASSLTWCIYELTKNPHLEETILSEVEVRAAVKTKSSAFLLRWLYCCRAAHHVTYIHPPTHTFVRTHVRTCVRDVHTCFCIRLHVHVVYSYLLARIPTGRSTFLPEPCL